MDKLTKLSELQKPLYDWFGVIKQKFPNYPVDLNTKSGQRCIKELTANLTEELSEAHEQYRNLYFALSQNTEDDKVYYENLQQELSDVLHFFMNIYLAIGMDSKDSVLTFEDNLELDTLDLIYNTLSIDALRDKLLPYSAFMYKDTLVEKDHIDKQAQLMFEVIYELQMLCNMLKNRDWRNVENHTVDMQAIRIRAWQALVGIIAIQKFHGFSIDGMINQYEQKNKINLQRITKQKNEQDFEI